MYKQNMSKLAAAIITLVLLTSIGLRQPSWAQPFSPEAAQELLDTARRLQDSGDDLAATLAAYERALAAYDALGDEYTSLTILMDLAAIHLQACQAEQAIPWVEETVRRLMPDDLQTLNSDELAAQIQSLGWLFIDAGQTERALEVYARGISYLEQLQQSALLLPQPASTLSHYSQTRVWDNQADLLLRQLMLQPEGGPETDRLLEQWLMVRQQASHIADIEVLLQNAEGNLIIGGRVQLSLLANALQLSQQHRYRHGEYIAAIWLSRLMLNVGDYLQASAYAQQATGAAEQLTRSEQHRLFATYLLARSQQELGNYEASIAHYRDVLTVLNAESTSSLQLPMDPLGLQFLRVSSFDVVASLRDLYLSAGQADAAAQLAAEYAGVRPPELTLLLSPWSFFLRPQSSLLGSFYLCSDQPGSIPRSPSVLPSAPTVSPSPRQPVTLPEFLDPLDSPD
jgi:tetratricopeptide (TPR) repeat protein